MRHVTYDGHDYLLVKARCFCREWEVLAGAHPGHCGFCGADLKRVDDGSIDPNQRTRLLGENDDD